MQNNRSLVDEVIQYLKNNKLSASFILFFVLISGLATLTQDLDQLARFWSSDPPDGNVEIVQLALDPNDSYWRAMSFSGHPGADLINGVGIMCNSELMTSFEKGLNEFKEEPFPYLIEFRQKDYGSDLTFIRQVVDTDSDGSSSYTTYFYENETRPQIYYKVFHKNRSSLFTGKVSIIPCFPIPQHDLVLNILGIALWGGTVDKIDSGCLPVGVRGEDLQTAQERLPSLPGSYPVFDATFVNNSSKPVLLTSISFPHHYQYAGGDIGSPLLGSTIETLYRYRVQLYENSPLLPPVGMQAGQVARIKFELIPDPDDVPHQAETIFWIAFHFSDGSEILSAPYYCHWACPVPRDFNLNSIAYGTEECSALKNSTVIDFDKP